VEIKICGKPDNRPMIGYSRPALGLAFTRRQKLIVAQRVFPQNALERRSGADEISTGQDGLMNIINREELKQKLDQRGKFTLVNCLDEWMFREKRIPGSIRFEKAFFETLNPKGEIIVYCSNPGCTASVMVYHQFVERGFQNVWHYPGGIADWEDGGYPMEGEHVH
jgi:thiosulfate/3-mercaptopyruvate sulfurtransferase